MMKRISTSLLALLLALCMILSACQKGKGSNENQDPTPTPPVSGENGNQNENQNLGACTHAQTALRNAKVASCTAAGYTGDEVCTACGATVRSGSTIAITDHTYDNGRVTKNPTCIEQGWKTFTCSGCGLTKGESIPTVPHQNEYHDMLNGEHQVTCGSCTMSDFDTHVPVDPNGTYYAATCTEDGYTEYICSLCEATYRVYSTTDTALNHDWSAWEVTTPNNCVDKGVKSHSCGRAGCGATEELPIPVAPGVHKELAVLRNQAATCQAAGKTVYYCTGCGTDDIEVIHEQLPHNLGAPASAGDGWTHQECENDGCDFKVSTFKATGTSASVSTEQLDEERAFEVETEKANVQFPSEVVSQMTGGSDVKIDAGTVEDKSAAISNATGLTEEEKQHLEKENVEIYDFGVTVDGEPLSEFDGGVTVTIDYELGDNEDPEGIIIWYIPEGSDQIEKIGDDEDERVTYNAETGKVTFVVKHFSFYAIAYEETQEMKCKRGLHDLAQVGESVVATCYNYGYTVFECNCCHTVEISGVVDMLDHVWSEMIDPQVTCTQGGYYHKVCQNDGCGAVKNFTYQRAEGHKADHVASCTQSSTCTVCNEVLVPAYGHSWSEWSVIVEPTDVKPGLRRRYCPSCGEVEEVKLSATGNIEQFKLESTQDLYEALYRELLDIDNGKVTFTSVMQGGEKITTNVTVNEENGSYLMLIEMVSEYNKKTYKERYLYRNGVLINVWEDDLWSGGVSHLDYSSTLPFDLMMDYTKQVFDFYMPTVEESFDEIRALLEIVDKTMGAEVDALLQANGHSFTVSRLADTFDSAQKIYLYAVLKLGFTTGLDLTGGVELPSQEDYENLLSAFMTATPDGDNTVYTLNAEQLMAALETVLTHFEQSYETSLSDYIWGVIDTSVIAAYPEVTDWAGFIAKLKTLFPGDMKVKDALDRLISSLEDDGVTTGDELYAIIDTLALVFAGAEFDSQAMIATYYDKTLDQMLQAYMGEEANMAALFDGIAQMMASQKLGEVVISRVYNENGEATETTLAQAIAMLRASLEEMQIKADFSITLDAAGRLVAFGCDEQLDFIIPETDEEPESLVTMQSFNATFVRDDSIKVEIPEDLKPVADATVESSFDADGNLIVKLPHGFDLDFDIYTGDIVKPLAQVIEKDAAMSAKLGYDVYVLDRALWSNSKEVASYYLYNGQYYKAVSKTDEGYRVLSAKYKFSDVQADPSILLPGQNAVPVGKYRHNGEVLDVYNTALAPVVMLEGSWMLLKNASAWNEYGVDENGNQTYNKVYSARELVDFAAATASIEISNMNDSTYQALQNGVPVTTRYAYIWLDVTAWGSETLGVQLYHSAQDDLYLCQIDVVDSVYYNVLGDAVSAPAAHDYLDENKVYDTVRDQAGNVITEQVKRVTFYAYIPTYYVKVINGTYTPLYSGWGDDSLASGLRSFVDTTEMQTVALPDGNTLFVLGSREGWNKYNGTEYDKLLYGYVKLADRLYLQTIAMFMGEDLVNFEYREAVSQKRIDLGALYDLDDYIEALGNDTYRIPVALTKALESECTKPGDSYAFMIMGEQKTTAGSFVLHALVGAYAVPEQINPGKLGGASADQMFAWDQFFSRDQQKFFDVIPNADGTITVTFQNDYDLDHISYTPGIVSVALGNVLKPNAQKSQETGLNIYSGKVDSYMNNYLYYNNKYYNYSWTSVLEYTSAPSYQDLIANNWKLRSLALRYHAIADEQGNVEETPVYQGEVTFYDSYYVDDVPRTYFFLLRDGKLHVLVGAEEPDSELDPLLKFESIMPASQYFARLAQSVQVEYEYDSWHGSEVYLFGQLINNPQSPQKNYYGYDSVRVTETDSMGNEIQSYSLRFAYIKIGEQKIVVKTAKTHSQYLHFDPNDPITLPADAVVDSTYTNSYFNGNYTFARVTTPSYEHFVKLAGSFYPLRSFDINSVSEHTMLREMGESAIYYAIHVAGKWRLFAQDGFSINQDGYAVLTKPVTGVTLPEWPSYNYQGLEVLYGGQTYDLYTVTGYILPKNVNQLKQSDGTVFYYNGEIADYTNGYLKANNGKYVGAYLVLQEDGSYVVKCNMSQAQIDMEAIRDRFDAHLTIDKGKRSVVISKEILSAVPASLRDDFAIIFGYWGDSALDYADLEGWFELAK